MDVRNFGGSKVGVVRRNFNFLSSILVAQSKDKKRIAKFLTVVAREHDGFAGQDARNAVNFLFP
jgi:hypothetical protein